MPQGFKTKELWKNPEYRQYMIDVHKGKPSPKKGIKTGKPAWNTGKKLPPLSLKQKEKLSKIAKEKGFGKWMKGRPMTEYNKKILLEKNTGAKYMLGKKDSEQTKQKKREASLSHPNRVFRDTSIELKIESELKRLGILFKKQVPLCKIARVDFLLAELKTIIQADGCYWHGCPQHFPNNMKSKEKDEKQDKILIENGFDVYRFWEHEINESVENCINKINLVGITDGAS